MKINPWSMKRLIWDQVTAGKNVRMDARFYSYGPGDLQSFWVEFMQKIKSLFDKSPKDKVIVQ